MYSCGPPHMAVQRQDDQHEHTFSSCVRIRDVVQKTYRGRWTIGRSGERGSGISVLPARYDDDDDDDDDEFNDFIYSVFCFQIYLILPILFNNFGSKQILLYSCCYVTHIDEVKRWQGRDVENYKNIYQTSIFLWDPREIYKIVMTFLA